MDMLLLTFWWLRRVYKAGVHQTYMPHVKHEKEKDALL